MQDQSNFEISFGNLHSVHRASGAKVVCPLYAYEIFVFKVLAASDADADEERVASDSISRNSSSVS